MEELCQECGQRVIALSGLDECPICGGALVHIFDSKAINCPVLRKTVALVQCFACPNYVQTIKGKVDCRGVPLPGM